MSAPSLRSACATRALCLPSGPSSAVPMRVTGRRASRAPPRAVCERSCRFIRKVDLGNWACGVGPQNHHKVRHCNPAARTCVLVRMLGTIPCRPHLFPAAHRVVWRQPTLTAHLQASFSRASTWTSRCTSRPPRSAPTPPSYRFASHLILIPNTLSVPTRAAHRSAVETRRSENTQGGVGT